MNQKYLEKENEKEQQQKEVISPWNSKDWNFVKKHLFTGAVSNFELMTKFCFFLKQPLRKLAKLNLEFFGFFCQFNVYIDFCHIELFPLRKRNER